MNTKAVKRIHDAGYVPIDNLITYSPLPSQELPMVDPFLLLNHHGPQQYPPHNSGLPFGPHPHRGMETVTFIVEGDIMHKDSGGHKSVVRAGGVQWMTAGRGVIHSENSSDEFLEHGGNMEILQLWVNLPARSKMTEPFYKGLQKEEIPTVESDGGRVRTALVAGTWDGRTAAFQPGTDISLGTIACKPGATLSLDVPADHNVLLYVIRGSLSVNDKAVIGRQLVEFGNSGTTIAIEAQTDSLLLFGHALPFNEPVVAQGPFVMNTREEIAQAYDDYRHGKFGIWKG